ncbi:Aste57867_8887 [Aphanomyces stellatus]|uniref:Aste57867_8887 protein n=1 Tax=Aphanomyces stellatus TaxID=120398 RepID=A0A485KLS0_9STRA|nr:hypothetical protein As57867_008852 [Aphanomyces stellatus]VFT85771.1 Aste57867_8887 [Aphanomyces stellatus]
MPSDVSYFFGGPLAINVFIVGGAANLMVFRAMGYPVEKVFGIQSDEIPSPRALLGFAAGLSAFLGTLYYLFKLHTISVIAKNHELVLVIYCLVVGALLVLPFNVLHLKFRKFLGRTLRRCLFPFAWIGGNQIYIPPTETPFVEVYIADGLTSMSKIFGDMAVATLMLWYSIHGVHDDMYQTKMKHHLVPYLAAASPIRAIQCLISYHRATVVNDKFLHVLNTFKYGTGLCVILVGALPVLFGPSPEQLLDTDTLFLLCACCNSLYSLFWDVVMDWGLGQPPNAHDVSEDEEDHRSPPLWNASKMNTHAYLRHTLLYRPKHVYYVAMAADAMLRVLWVTSNWHWVDVVGADFKMVAQVAEVCRRCMWNLLRVEWQCVKLGLRKPKRLQKSKSSDDKLVALEAATAEKSDAHVVMPPKK